MKYNHICDDSNLIFSIHFITIRVTIIVKINNLMNLAKNSRDSYQKKGRNHDLPVHSKTGLYLSPIVYSSGSELISPRVWLVNHIKSLLPSTFPVR